MGVVQRPQPASITYSYDLNGNTTATSTGFNYNVRDQTTSLTLGAGSPLSFGYAGAGQSERTSRAGTAQHNTLLGLSREGTTSWTSDPGGTLISQRASGGVRHYYLADGLGSVVGLTDSTGALTRSYKYDPYGALRSTTGSTPNPFQYTGQYSEAGGGLYKIGARYYAPNLGRWTQQDPLDQAGDLREGNRYVYGAADPVNLVDPTGTSVFDDVAEAFDDVVDAVQDDARDVQQVWNDARSFLRSAGGRVARNCIIGGGIGFSVAAIAKQSAKKVPLVIGGCAVVNIVRRGR